jgi:type VI protein secretion system component Hcp
MNKAEEIKQKYDLERNERIKDQYDQILRMIANHSFYKEESNYLCYSGIYPENLESLTADGFIITKVSDGCTPTLYYISYPNTKISFPSYVAVFNVNSWFKTWFDKFVSWIKFW